MKHARIFFSLSSALIIAASVYGVSAEARTSYDQCMEEGLGKAECACEFALKNNSQKALQNFLKLYRNANTACNAMASTANLSENKTNGGEVAGGSSSSSSSSSSGGSSGGSSKDNNGLGNGDEGDCQGGGCGDSDNPGNGGSSGGNGGNGGGGNSNGNSNH